MAKLKAPLLSFGASGAIAKAVVYFNWKGLNVAREYVIPSNPKTTLQKTQRGYLRDVVAKIHYLQASATEPLRIIDIMAYALWGSIYPTPRTWFNQAVKNWLNQKVATKNPGVYHNGAVTPAAEQITLRLDLSPESGAMTEAEVYWGTSKTALLNKQAVTVDELHEGIPITGMAKSTKYFLQVRPTDPDTLIGDYSGIYYAKTLAA